MLLLQVILAFTALKEQRRPLCVRCYKCTKKRVEMQKGAGNWSQGLSLKMGLGIPSAASGDGTLRDEERREEPVSSF